jgi:uncharacterized protein YkwD
LPKCDICAEEIILPFECNYCGKTFCAKHRLPENHDCPYSPRETPWHLRGKDAERKQAKPTQSIEREKQFSDEAKFANKEDWFHFEPGKTWEEKQKRSKRREIILSILAFSVVAALLCSLFLNPASFQNMFTPNPLPNLPPKTYSHAELVDYAMSLINLERQNSNLNNVTLSETNCAQKHADNMLKNNYLSHWDLRGFKPHMRYTMAGGLSSVSENCGWISYSLALDAKEALRDLERGLEESHGHWLNIVNPFHNRVDIGIAYGNNNYYIVQDFENDYVVWENLTVSDKQVEMRGEIQKHGLAIASVDIYYDKPVNLTIQQLGGPPYNYSYDLGTFVGMVLPSGWESTEGITITAGVWSQTMQNFEVKFEPSEALRSFGSGVYTFCLKCSSLENNSTQGEYLTSYSFWYDG